MKTLAPTFLFFFLSLNAVAQSFEGSVTYAVDVKTKDGDPVFAQFYRMLLRGGAEQKTVSYSGRKTKISTGIMDVYTDADKKRVYYKFKKIDTLFYLNFDSDTTTVLSVDKSDPGTSIAGYSCKKLVLHEYRGTTTCLYAEKLPADPSCEQTNTVWRMDRYYKETGGGIGLHSIETFDDAITTDSCLSVNPGKVDPAVFAIPSIPEVNLNGAHLFKQSTFPGGPSKWAAYLQKNIDMNTMEKYVPLKKRQASNSIRVVVVFTVNVNGSITDVKAENTEGIPPQLVTEAIRVIKNSPNWTPSILYGETVPGKNKQSVAFSVEREK